MQIALVNVSNGRLELELWPSSVAPSVGRLITRQVLWSQDMSRDHKTCHVITRHVLWSQDVSWSQDMSCDHETCLVITIHVLWSQDMSRDHKTCLVIQRQVWWPHDVFCDYKTCLPTTGSFTGWFNFCFRIGGHACALPKLLAALGGVAPQTPAHESLCLWARTTCLVITRHVLWSQAMSCDHETCLVITRHVLWSQDLSCALKRCLVITRLVITRHVLWAHLLDIV